jgi:hypothetical protein
VNGSVNCCGNLYANHATFVDFMTVGYSDERLKDRIENLDCCLEKIDTLSAFLYRPKTWAIEEFHLKPEARYGLSAQEVYEVFPDAVNTAAFGDQYLTLDYTALVPVLVRCIQELKRDVQDIKRRLH